MDRLLVLCYFAESVDRIITVLVLVAWIKIYVIPRDVQVSRLLFPWRLLTVADLNLRTIVFKVRLNFIIDSFLRINRYTYYVLNIQIGYNVSTCYVMGLGFVIVISLCSRYYVNTNIKRAVLYACYCIDYSTWKHADKHIYLILNICWKYFLRDISYWNEFQYSKYIIKICRKISRLIKWNGINEEYIQKFRFI